MARVRVFYGDVDSCAVEAGKQTLERPGELLMEMDAAWLKS